ncbi:uncharacterized protein F5147DRAFT_652165 [Suillus discolor]|uniref:Uncharacterized protein n=1 Tax=Suillus discolor TaxID=1912936 RepID=A0A9P7JVE1_9AGAM|nr:uncharacterized protein F5147DRAFT_652165 [Suillus discolor]KAG2109995.1 hypothetical protein F5147DRAFT_652165 [Suillus discolor]
MTPEAANDALNITLATLQSLIKRCIHLKCVIGAGKRLKALWGKCYIIFSPQLLSCAAVVQQYSKGGTFQTLPDWNSVVDDDPRIKSHPHFHKTLDYCPLAAVGTLPILEAQATGSSSIVRPLTVPAAVGPFTKQAPAVEVDSTPLSPLPTSLELEPLTPLAPSVAPATPSTARHKLFVPGNISKKVKVTLHPRNDKKRQVEEDDTDSAGMELQRQESLWSAVSQNILDPEAQDAMDTASDNSFWDAETRVGDFELWHGAEWNLLYKHFSLMIGVWIQRLLQQWSIQFATIRGNVTNARNQAYLALFCRTKKSDAHDSFAQIATGQRLQAQAKATAVTQAADRPKRSRSRVPKARAVSEMLKKDSPASLTMPAVSLSTPVVKEIAEHGNVEKQPINLTVTPVEETLFSFIAKPGQTSQSEQVHPMGVDHPAEQEPTAKDILQAIRDLGNKFDLLATNERVDALDAKVNSVEEVFGHRLATLEQHINSSDAQSRAMSSSVGHLTNCLRDHKDDLEAHRPRVNTTTYAPLQHPTAQLPVWLHGTGGVDDVGISTVGRQWTHAWDPSVATGVQGCLETSASATQTGYPHDTPVIRTNSIQSSRLSSTPSAMSDNFISEFAMPTKDGGTYDHLLCKLHMFLIQEKFHFGGKGCPTEVLGYKYVQ